MIQIFQFTKFVFISLEFLNPRFSYEFEKEM